MIDRIPPNNTDAEESVLAALFINNQSFEDIDGLSPTFINQHTARYFRQCCHYAKNTSLLIL